jgi:hypothetical protein
MTETGEEVETGGVVEIASIHAVFVHVTENMVGYELGQGEYPTLSAIRRKSAELCVSIVMSIPKFFERPFGRPFLASVNTDYGDGFEHSDPTGWALFVGCQNAKGTLRGPERCAVHGIGHDDFGF